MRPAFVVIASLVLCAPAAAQSVRLFSVGSGNLDGGYFAATRSLCDVFNRAERNGLRCSPESTPGSLYNLMALGSGQLDFALVQSDWQGHAFKGTSLFASRGAMPRLRSVMSLYPEPFNLIARRDTRVGSIRDLVGKRVDIGEPSSGRQATMRALMEMFGLKLSDFRLTAELSGDDAIEGLCDGQIDAAVLITGHPNPAIARALGQCDAELVSLDGPEIERVISGGGIYTRATIARGTYAPLHVDVNSFAVRATVVTLSSMDDDIVEAFVRNALAQVDILRQKTPILATLDAQDMPSLGLTAPLHPAAKRAFDRVLARTQ